MAKKKRTLTKDELVGIALDLAVARGWGELTLRDIASAADLSLSALHEMFEDKDDILVAFGRMIDRRVLEAVGEGDLDPDVSPRDALFDIMMERFDALNDYRAGLVAVLKSFRCDPKQAVIAFPHLCKSMTWMLEAAGVETTGIRGALKVAGLTTVYLDVLRTWMDDESADLAQTMAALDKDLSRAEKVINMIGL